jgi:sugar/nucleoside kinase (ribokinase family)
VCRSPVEIACGAHILKAAKFTNAAGALACTKLGAQSALPTAAETRLLVQDQAT